MSNEAETHKKGIKVSNKNKEKAKREDNDAVVTTATVMDVKKKNEERAKRENQVYKTMNYNDIHWQGDVGILCIKEVPEGTTIVENHNGQLAEGNTRGSRHIVKAEHMANVTFYVKPDANALEGNVLKCNGPVEITHPDHGHVTVPAGVYQICYQRQLDKELKRVMD